MHSYVFYTQPVQQFKLAEYRKIPAAVFVPEDWTPGSNSLSVRNLVTRESAENLSLAEAAAAIRDARDD